MAEPLVSNKLDNFLREVVVFPFALPRYNFLAGIEETPKQLSLNSRYLGRYLNQPSPICCAEKWHGNAASAVPDWGFGYLKCSCTEHYNPLLLAH